MTGDMIRVRCARPCLVGLVCAASAVISHGALAFGRVSIGPYASVSSTKAIKPDKVGKDKESDASTATETVTQRTTYGLKIDVRLSKLFQLNVNGGVNAIDQTKKPVAMRDEYGDIDFQKDANVDPNAQSEEYRYKEEQRLATAKLSIAPMVTKWLSVMASAGVRARQRLIDVENKATGEVKKIEDPIRYHAVAGAGFKARLLRAFTAHAEYNFYFLKFPETEPHEQEVVVGFGVSI